MLGPEHLRLLMQLSNKLARIRLAHIGFGHEMPLGGKNGIWKRSQATVLSANLSTDRQSHMESFRSSHRALRLSIRSCNGSIRPTFTAMTFAFFQLILGQDTKTVTLLTSHLQFPRRTVSRAAVSNRPALSRPQRVPGPRLFTR